jgi:surface polysaccharide O-acyltransferase-like enzyme
MQEGKIIYIDNLRFIATISVIILHVSTPFLFEVNGTISFNWLIGNFFDSTVRFCVPIFVMITGALLLPRVYHLRDFLRNRFTRILFPFLFWTIIYFLIGEAFKYKRNGSITFMEILIDLFNSIKNGTSYHFWYIYMLIGLYLFIPIVGAWVRNAKKNEIHYFLLIWLITSIINTFLLYRFIPDVNLVNFSGYLGFLVLGYYLSIYDFKINYILICCATIVGIITTFFLTFYFSSKMSEFIDSFYNNFSLNVIFTSISVFILAKKGAKLAFFNESDRIYQLFHHFKTKVNNCSYGIYLAHVLVLNILYKINFDKILVNPILNIPFISITCLLFSLILVICFKKIPIIRNYIS